MEVQQKLVKPPGQRWMYKGMAWVSTKDMVSLPGLDNTDVSGKEVYQSLGDLIRSLLVWSKYTFLTNCATLLEKLIKIF